ncbi:cytochrome P450 736A117-like [Rutidosis leptorrhynchoides]|uniref:cytochrome P450 736A117-like n=1 Tax=Rutidosis leptorrhynchoides TaxID=125765 RepID=UPI003A99B70A
MAAFLIYILSFLLTLFLFIKFYYSTPPTTTNNPPPSPPKFPVIGNLHQLTPLIHRSFFSLSNRYGPYLMLLHLGSIPTLVVSSNESAYEILQTHDLEFSSKPSIKVHQTVFYNSKEIAVAPYGEHWRQAKKTIVLHYLSNKMVQNFSVIRDEEIAFSVNEIEKLCSGNNVVNLSDLIADHTNGVSCRATFGRKYNSGEDGKKFKRILQDLLEVVTHFYFADSIPKLAWIDQIMGANGKAKNVARYMDEFLEAAIEERVVKDDHDEVSEGVEPFIDALLRIQKESVNEIAFDRDTLKALLMDAYLDGTDTTSSLLEWTMTELLTHPSFLNKLQEEVRTVVKGKQHITDEDIEQMKYLKAVIMETTRLHPPVPVPPGRVATQDSKVMGYDIAKGTRVYINIWAIGRDPKLWDKPNEFVPERFVNGSVDFVKHDFKFIPFGAGRRGCPGRVFGLAVVENLLANLLCKFDWALPDRVKEEGVDMEETVGLATHKKVPLLAFATPFSL